MTDFSTTSTSSRGIFKTIVGVVAVIAFLGIVFFFARSSGSGETNGIVLFYGDGCPHCAIVDAFIKENGVEEKVSFIRKEVYGNKRNAREMASLAKKCGMATESIGIPFLWTGTTCLTGDKDIMAYFQSKIGVPAAAASSSR